MFSKDILNLVYICRFYNLNEVADYWEEVVKLNNWQRRRISTLVVQKLYGTVTAKKVSILGFSFKANTNDTRESASLYIVKDLLENGAIVSIHDPKVSMDQIQMALGTEPKQQDDDRDFGWFYEDDIYESVRCSDAIIILTEWEEYRNLDWIKCFNLMRKPSWVLILEM